MVQFIFIQGDRVGISCNTYKNKLNSCNLFWMLSINFKHILLILNMLNLGINLWSVYHFRKEILFRKISTAMISWDIYQIYFDEYLIYFCSESKHSDRRIDWLTKIGPNFENYMWTCTIMNVIKQIVIMIDLNKLIKNFPFGEFKLFWAF